MIPAIHRANPDGKIPLCGEKISYQDKEYIIEGVIASNGVFNIWMYPNGSSVLSFEDVVSSDWDESEKVWMI